MTDLAPVIDRFPALEFTVRRLCVSQEDFRRLCEDYSIARCALGRWKADEAKAEDYRRLVRELEEEILEYIKSQHALPGEINSN